MKTTFSDLDGDELGRSVLLHGTSAQICGRGGMRATMEGMRLLLLLALAGCSAVHDVTIASSDGATAVDLLSSEDGSTAAPADLQAAPDQAAPVDLASTPADLTTPRDYGLCAYPTRALCTSSAECACSTGTCANANDGNMRCCQRTGQACGIAVDCCKATGFGNGQCTSGKCG